MHIKMCPFFSLLCAINIAVFEYKDSDGAVKTITRASQRGKGHSEKLIAEELKKLGIPNKNVTRIYSELAPCSAPGGFCKSMIEQGSKKSKLGPFNNAKVTYSIEYGGTPHDPAKAAKGMVGRTITFAPFSWASRADSAAI